MATEIWSSTGGATDSPLSSANFTAVIEELHDKLVANGLDATADTGQLDFTALAGGTPALTPGSWLGYRMYHLDDGVSLPLYLKLRFGVAASSTSSGCGQFALEVSFGFGTDGAGTLTGGASTTFQIAASVSTYTNANPPANLISMLSISEGFIGLSWKQRYFEAHGSYGPSSAITDAGALAGFALCRTTDDAGNVTADGATLVLAPGSAIQWNSRGPQLRTVHLTAAGVQYSTQRAAVVLASDAISTIGGAVPVYNIFAMTPAPRRIMQVGAVYRPAASASDLTSMAMVGTSPRTYRIIPEMWPGDLYGAASTVACVAMLWE